MVFHAHSYGLKFLCWELTFGTARERELSFAFSI